MKKITCMIVEDEPLAMQLLQDHIRKVLYLELRGSCYDAKSAMQFLSEYRVDVIFLDINMPGITGLEMAAMLSKEQKIIFTTAYSAYALDSFEYHVIDYLLKPISFNRFMQAMNKLNSVTENKALKEAQPETENADFLFVKSGKQVLKIEYASIHYIEALKEYIAIYTTTEKILVYKRMKDVAAMLPSQFIRIHNSYIVNIKQIRNIESNIVVVKGQSLPVSNSYRELFQQRIHAKLL